MGFNPNIRREISRLTNEEKDKVTERDIYESAEFREYLENLTGTLLDSKKKLPVVVVSKGKDGPAAVTNGDRICINWENRLFSDFADAESRFEAVMGAFFHEMSHVLYMDFDLEKEAALAIGQGQFYGDPPDPDDLSDEDEQLLNELKEAMSDPDYRGVFMRVYNDLDNIIADRHDEDAIMQKYGGLCTQGICKAREGLYADFDSVETGDRMVQEGKLTRLEAFYNALLQFSRFDNLFVMEDASWQTSETLRTLCSISTNVEVSHSTDDVYERYTAINIMMLKLWKYIKEELDKQTQQKNSAADNNSWPQDGSSQKGLPQNGTRQDCNRDNGLQQSNPQHGTAYNGNAAQKPDSKMIQSVLDQLNRASQSVGMTQVPDIQRSSRQAKEKRDSERSRKLARQKTCDKAEEQTGTNSTSDILKEAKDRIAGSIARRKAEDRMDEELSDEFGQDVLGVDMNSNHKGIPLVTSRVTSNNRSEYERIIKEVSPYSRRLQREIENSLRDMKEGGLSKHRQYGKMFRVQDAYRPDDRMFANRKLPEDIPEMAISVLVDNSGSMGGDRIAAAIKTSVLLYDFATSLDIPVSVSGHCAEMSGAMYYNLYADFERAGDADRYRIASMRPQNCNRDGMAIEIAASLLSKRPENVKLMIIITDGRPNHDEYGGEQAMEDIRSIVRRYKTKGVEVIAAAIGDDKEAIREIYNDGFIDIADLSKLPQTLTRLVKNRIIHNAA